jgi:hypothetical protein
MRSFDFAQLDSVVDTDTQLAAEVMHNRTKIT